MPTFRSIPIHPSVRSRLLHTQQQQQHTNDHSKGAQDPNEPRQQQQQQQQQQPQQHQPIKSSVAIPRSLLTRDPYDLVDLFSNNNGDGATNEQKVAGIRTLRNQVALAMVSQTRNGKRLLRQNPPPQYEDNHPPQHKKRNRQQDEEQSQHAPLIPGASMSLMQALNLQRERTKPSNNLPRQQDQRGLELCSTGCRALDSLVAFPAEYFFFSSSSSSSSPSFDNNSDPENVRAIHCNTIDMDSGEARGIPRGYVLQLSGTTGKTQLALQFAAQAITQLSQQSPGSNERIRYCYSTAGHSGSSLAKRLFQLLEQTSNSDHGTRMDAARKIDFQPVSTLSQLTTTLAKLEEEWLEHTTAPEHQQQQRTQEGHGGGKGPVAMLVFDSLPSMMTEREETERIRSLDRWLRRIARHYSIWIVVVTHGGGSSLASASVYGNAMSADIHLGLRKQTPARSILRLLRHPAKAVTEQDSITVLHNSKCGITTPEE